MACSGDSLRLSGPWVSSSHPASDNFHHFSSEFIDISPIRQFLHRCAPIWSPPPTIVHLGDFFRHMAPVPSSIYHVFTQQLRFFHQLHQIFEFFVCAHTCCGLYHPPGAAIAPHNQLATHPTCLLA